MTKEIVSQRIVLVTGASRGIGRALAFRFAEEGDAVVVNYLKNESAAAKTVKEIEKNGGKARAVRADVADPSAVASMSRDILEKEKSIDVLINNAGICANTTLLKMEEADWDSVVKTDLNSAFYTIRAFSKAMMMRKSGSVINIASISGLKGAHGSGNYAAAKGGLIALTKSAAIELGRFGICVNAVCPGFHLTDMGRHATDRYIEETKKASVLGLTTDINELADFVYMLSLSKTVSGQVFNWDSRII
ncbi:MAG: SDR family NAD(P)-dependent oxidoreductase [Elusimicrobiota bacterium]